MNVLLKKMLVQFVPELKQEAAPAIDRSLKDLLSKYDKQLQEGESCSDILIERDGENIYVHICSMSEDNKVIRVLERWESSALLELLLNSIDKI